MFHNQCNKVMMRLSRIQNFRFHWQLHCSSWIFFHKLEKFKTLLENNDNDDDFHFYDVQHQLCYC